jgi:hypothetical protein
MCDSPPETWSCEICTLINPSSLKSCDACGSPHVETRGRDDSAPEEDWVFVDPASRPPLCDCMASEHALFSLCLYCGKVLCAIERGAACSACGAQPRQRRTPGASYGSNVAAVRNAEADFQTERLLANNRLAAEIGIGESSVSEAWLGPEEQEAARQAEAAARRAHVRSGRALRLCIDLEARQAFDMDADIEERERTRQLSDIRSHVAASAQRAARVFDRSSATQSATVE